MSAPPITERHKPHFHRRAPFLESVRVATTANITISTALNNGDILDGVTLATGDRVLVKNQSTGSQNGIYVVGATPVRDYDESTDDPSFGWLVFVREGTTNGGTLWANTNTSTPTIGTTALTFSEFSSGSSAASDVTIADAGGYFTGTDVEAALQELAAREVGYLAHGNTGATETFDASAAGWHSATLDADCTFTLTGATSGVAAQMLLELAQDGTGGWSITLPASVVNKTELEAAQDTTAGQTTFLLLITRDGGTSWYGFWTGGSAVAALDDLSDVTLTTPAAGDRLRYDGSAWVNSTLIWKPVMDGLGNVLTDSGTGEAIMAEVAP